MGDISGAMLAAVSGGPPPRATSSGLFDISLSGVRRSLSSLLKKKHPIVRIGDEDVIMDETLINPERAIHYGKIGFRKSFFPALTEGDELEDKRQSFKKVFAESTFFKKEDPLPPCNAIDRKNILDGLSNRIDQLSNEILTMMDVAGQTITSELTGAVNRLTTLKTLEAKFLKNEENRQCMEYDQATDPVIMAGLEAEDDDKMRILLRQFAVLLLQAEQPLEEYEELNDSVKDLTNILEKTGFTKAEADAYIELWRKTAKESAQGKIIPPVLSETLDVTDTQEGIVKKTVGDEHEALYRAIVNSVSAMFAGNEALSKEWSDRLKDSMDLDSMSKLNKLFNDISQMTKTYEKQKTDREVILMESAKKIEDLSSSIAAKTEELDAQQKALAEIQTALDEANGKATGASGALTAAQAELEAAKKSFEQQIAEVQNTITGLQWDLDAAKINAAAAEKEVTAAKETAAAAAAAAAEAEAARAGEAVKAVEANAAAAALAEQITALKAALAEKEPQLANLTSLTALTAEQDAQLKKTREEVATLRADLAMKWGEIAALKNKIEPLEKRLAELEPQLAAAVAENESLKKTIASNEKVIQDKNAQLESKQTQLSNLKTIFQNNLDLMKQLQTEREQLTKASANKNSNINKYKENEKNFADQIATLNGEILTREEDVEKLNREILILKKSTAENKKLLDSQKETIKTIKKDRDDTIKELEQLKGSSVLKGDVREEIENLRRTYGTTPLPSAYTFKYFRDDKLLRQPFLNLFLNASKTITAEKKAATEATAATAAAAAATAAAAAAKRAAAAAAPSSTVKTATGPAPAMSFSMDYSDAALLRRKGTAAVPAAAPAAAPAAPAAPRPPV